MMLQRAIATLFKFGFPSKLASAIRRIWQSQVRVLQWQRQSNPKKQHIMSSLPQGDALSPWALNLVLTTAIRQIQEQWPQSVQVIFIDDRSFVYPNLSRFGMGGRSIVFNLGLSKVGAKLNFSVKRKKKGLSWLNTFVRGPFSKILWIRHLVLRRSAGLTRL